jgi:hypothetical protein
MAEAQIDRSPFVRPGTLTRQVRVTIPARVAYDLDSFTDVLKSILDRLGCQACCSDFDIRWDIQRDFHVNQNGELQEL